MDVNGNVYSKNIGTDPWQKFEILEEDEEVNQIDAASTKKILEHEKFESDDEFVDARDWQTLENGECKKCKAKLHEEHGEEEEDDDAAWQVFEVREEAARNMNKVMVHEDVAENDNPFDTEKSLLQNCEKLNENAKPVFTVEEHVKGLMDPHVIWEPEDAKIDQVDATSNREKIVRIPPGMRGTDFARQKYTREQFLQAQREDPIIRALDYMVKEQTVPEGLLDATRLTEVKKYYTRHRTLWFHTASGILARKRTNKEAWLFPKNRLLIVPQRYVAIVLMHCHDSVGHRGRDKTMHCIRERFDWLDMRRDLSSYVDSCKLCQMTKPGKHTKFPLTPILTNHPNELVQIDHLSLSKTKNGNKAVLVAIDMFSKYCEAYPVKDYGSATTIDLLYRNWFSRFGNPAAIHSDNGSSFTSGMFHEFLKASEVEELHGTPYHPQSQGGVERMNSTLCNLLRKFADKQEDWDEWLPIALSAYNSTVHSTTGFTPNMLMLARETSTPLGYFFPLDDEEEPSDMGEFVRQRVARREEVLRMARHNAEQKQKRMKRLFDEKIKQINRFHINSLVMIKTGKRKVGETKKLTPCYIGPLLVTAVHGNGRGYTLSNGKRIHYERLRDFKIRPGDLIIHPDSADLEYDMIPDDVSEDEQAESIACTEKDDWISSEDETQDRDAKDELLEDHTRSEMHMSPEELVDNRSYRTRDPEVRKRYVENSDESSEDETKSEMEQPNLAGGATQDRTPNLDQPEECESDLETEMTVSIPEVEVPMQPRKEFQQVHEVQTSEVGTAKLMKVNNETATQTEDVTKSQKGIVNEVSEVNTEKAEKSELVNNNLLVIECMGQNVVMEADKVDPQTRSRALKFEVEKITHESGIHGQRVKLLESASDQAIASEKSDESTSTLKPGDVKLRKSHESRKREPRVDNSWGMFEVGTKVNEIQGPEMYEFPECDPIETPMYEELIELCRSEEQKPRKYAKWLKEENCFKTEKRIQQMPKSSKHIQYHEDDFLQTQYPMVIAATKDFNMQGRLQGTFKRQFGGTTLLFDQRKQVGEVATLGPKFARKRGQYLFYAIVKTRRSHQANVRAWANSLFWIRKAAVKLKISDIAMPVVDDGLDGILWRSTYKIVDAIFNFMNIRDGEVIKVHAYSYFYTSLLYEIYIDPNTNEDYDDLEFSEYSDKLYDPDTRTIKPLRLLSDLKTRPKLG